MAQKFTNNLGISLFIHFSGSLVKMLDKTSLSTNLEGTTVLTPPAFEMTTKPCPLLPGVGN